MHMFTQKITYLGLSLSFPLSPSLSINVDLPRNRIPQLRYYPPQIDCGHVWGHYLGC